MEKEKFLALTDSLKGKNVYVQTHNFPDPDAIGAGFGLVKLLEHFGIRATLIYVGEVDRVNIRKMTDLCRIEIYPVSQLPQEMKEKDPIICIDSQKTGGNIKDLIGDEIACIDHHPLIQGVTYRYCDVRKAGSCATLIAEYFSELSIEPDPPTATALLYGLKMDTMHFTRGVTLQDIEMHAFLFPYVSADIIGKLEQNNLELEDLKAYGAAINNIYVHDSFGFAHIPFACADAQIATVADFVLSLEEVDVAVLYAERPDGWKFSVRSEMQGVDAGKLIAKALDGVGSGGGHAFMAGGFVPAANVSRFGEHPDERIRELFLNGG